LKVNTLEFMVKPQQAKLDVVGLKAYYFTRRGVVRAVDDLTFAINKSESLGIAGESACGKSTLGSSLLRALQPPGKIVGGKITLDGMDVSGLSDPDFDRTIRWKRIAMIFQGAMNALDPVYKIGDQMNELMRQHHFVGNTNKIISESLEQVGLDQSVTRRYPHELSGGMKQRVVIAMALLLKPEIVIADEPTTALDMLMQAQIINVLKRLKEENGMTIVLITHDLAIISEIADKIGIMYAGHLIEFGKASEIFENPKHPYTQALISAIPTIHGNKKEVRFIRGNPPDLTQPLEGCRFYERCPHAMDVCRKDPPLINSDTGFTRCWLYDKR
jgi:peptide/nickel transport system ATP-binding protein